MLESNKAQTEYEAASMILLKRVVIDSAACAAWRQRAQSIVIELSRLGLLEQHPAHPHVRAHGMICDVDDATGLCVECGAANN